MTKEDALLQKRFEELYERAFSRDVPTTSDFLNLYEQDLFVRSGLEGELVGGYEAAERRIAVFGSADWFVPPLKWIKIEPLSQKFADKLTHRDFLGALMNLGIERKLLGDIIVKDNMAWLVCLENIAEYICTEFTKCKHTSVKCSLSEEPPAHAGSAVPVQEVVASLRLDGIISAAFKLSRSDGKKYVEQEKVFINGKLASSAGLQLKEGEIVSVRGLGRFVYLGVERQTKKGSLRVNLGLYK